MEGIWTGTKVLSVALTLPMNMWGGDKQPSSTLIVGGGNLNMGYLYDALEAATVLDKFTFKINTFFKTHTHTLPNHGFCLSTSIWQSWHSLSHHNAFFKIKIWTWRLEKSDDLLSTLPDTSACSFFLFTSCFSLSTSASRFSTDLSLSTTLLHKS